MTREEEEAIEILRDWDGYFIGHSSDDVNKALEIAIDSIKEVSRMRKELEKMLDKLKDM